eukprot:GGOE01003537.1.p1 GENE.GGOE01003537.1~~GGOE01003537.1.p1  ORF type:complete len:274 (+),score=40.99 GGOE01003537.1:238-1059(+)
MHRLQAGVPSAERRAQWPEDARQYVQLLEQKIAELVVMHSMGSMAPLCTHPDETQGPGISSDVAAQTVPPSPLPSGSTCSAVAAPPAPPLPLPLPATPLPPPRTFGSEADTSGAGEDLGGLLKQLMHLQTLFQKTSSAADTINTLDPLISRNNSAMPAEGGLLSSTPAQEEWVTLDLRGRRFRLRRSDINKYPESHIGKVFGGKFKVPLPLKDGATVIDRDPRFFSLIVAYLEERPVELPQSEEELALLEKEVRYYGLLGLLQMVHQRGHSTL